MEPEAFNFWDLAIKLLATSGAAAWLASFLSNKRGQNKVLDFIMDAIELVGGNINKAQNDKTV